MCHHHEIALRTLQPAVVHRLRARLDDLSAAASLGYAAKLPGRFRALAVDGQFALQLHAGFQLVITPAEKPAPRNADGSLNLDEISTIVVVSIGKAHD
jgi:hypothetical protein